MPNVLTAEFHRRRSVAGLQKITVRQKFENHTLVFLDYRITDHKTYLLPDENTPVQAKYGKSPTGVETFYGYVNHYETIVDEAGRALTRMVCLGTSKPMNAMHPNSWLGTTRSSIVRDIARRYRLRSVVHSHPYVQDTWATGARSDFHALVAAANEAGYRLWVDGATVWFLNPALVLRNASSMSTPVITRRMLRSATVLGGSNIPGEMDPTLRRVQYGLDYRTNEPFLATSGDPSLPVQMTSSTVNTFGEAQQIAEAAERRQHEHFIFRATLDGNALLHPGSQFGVESGRVNTDQGGLWLATETQHEVSATEFQTKVVASRGEDRLPLARVPATVRGATGITRAIIRADNKWEAAFQEHLNG